MIFREATLNDIQPIMKVRLSVRENVLSNPDLVTQADCIDYIFNRGKGWVCEVNGTIAGFAIVDLIDKNVWALFIDPDFEKRGMGRQLHDIMVDWYFTQTNHTLWLGTDPGTRAEGFYRKAGWIANGWHGKEIKFEMTAQRWRNQTVKTLS